MSSSRRTPPLDKLRQVPRSRKISLDFTAVTGILVGTSPGFQSQPYGTHVAIALFKNALSKNALSQTIRPRELPWFALTVRPNHEHTAARALLNRGFEAYLPIYRVRRRWSDRIKELNSVLFPGYVFCRFLEPDRMRVLNSPGIRSIVGAGKDPSPVDEAEISAIRKLLSTGRPIAPWPYIRVGQNVIVSHGPLAFLRGVVVRAKDSWRVVISVDALGCSLSIEVDSGAVAAETSSYVRS